MSTGRLGAGDTAIQPTILNAKADLLTATAADTPARLAVGDDGETLVADSSATVGLRYTATPSASNPIINASMQVWQRGTSIAVSTLTYTADRWEAYRFIAGSTVSRQVTGDTTNLPNIQYCARVQRDSGNTGTDQIWFSQSFETVNTIPFVGKTITLSYYARAGANYSSTGNSMSVLLFTGTGTDQNITGYTGSAATLNTSSTLTTTWQRFSQTVTIPTTTTEMGVQFRHPSPSGTAGASDYFEVTGVQIDIGSVALPFRTYAATLAGELAACQRYYTKSAQTGTAPANGNPYNTNGLYQMNTTNSTTNLTTSFFPFPVNMRVAPTMAFLRTDLGSTANQWHYYTGSWTAATTTSASTTDKGFSLNLAGTYTANNAYTISGGFTASAEL